MIDQSTLHHFHPENTGLAEDIRPLLARSRRKRWPCEREAFLALLAGVPALRKTPGIPDPRQAGGFTSLPLCPTEADQVLCRNHLKSVFGVTDKESLLSFCEDQLCCNNNYLDFEGFWEGRPPFDPTALKRESADFFIAARDFSAQFYPLLGHQGYLAWDISESMGLLRAGLACGLLTREEFDPLADSWVLQAQIFGSWEEYAVSLVCGALYWDFRQGSQLPDLQNALRMWMDLVRNLLANDAAWDSGFWFTPKREKPFRLWPSEFRRYVTDWEGPRGCFITDQVTVEGKKIGWCYREEPEGDFPDSGWRFFSGEESDEYINDPKNTSVADINSACNFDPDILPLLAAPYGSAFARGEDGTFRPEPFEPAE